MFPAFRKLLLAIRAGPSRHPVAQAMQAAREHHRAGRVSHAEDICRQLLRADPDNPDALNLLGVMAHQAGSNEIAAELIGKAARLDPSNPNFLNNLGEASRASGRWEEAVARYDEALAIKPDHVGALSNRGNALQQIGRNDEAIASYREAISLKPDFAEAHNNLGAALREQGRLEEAVESFRSALSFKPDYAEAHVNLGAALRDQGREAAAIASFRQALSLNPDFAEAQYGLGVLLKDQGRQEEAAARFREALSLKPGLVEARWALAMSKIPAVPDSGAATTGGRAEFGAALAELDGWFRGERVKEGFKAVGSHQPFYLAYQEDNNRDLLSRYGALCFRLMDDWLRRQGPGPAGTASPGIIRLAIVSSHFCDHSVWQALLKGWLQQLDRGRFQLHLFHLGAIQDDQTAFARRNATTFSHAKGALMQWVEAIRAQQPDVVIYPEIGMDPMTVKLASMRLAPVQLAAWGHPETTGLPSIDYYISAEGFEPDNAGAHYTESLVRLPHLGCSYPSAPVTPTEPDLHALAIDGTVPLLICPGVPYKYAPQYDRVLVDIARKLGRCQFVFFAYSAGKLSEVLQHRLRSVFTQAGLRYDDFVVSIPWQEKSAFYGLMRRADAYLDTIGFSGFNTAMQAVACGLPIVTREGRFMRGRLAGGILHRMGMSELVAPTEDAYVALAVRLARDAEYRQGVRERMRQSRSVLFDDPVPVRALEEFLTGASGRKPGAPRDLPE
jgi:predicted O-linked N-acetylglucosamine transferase (SPINDLY family)